jgi:hypothetical protein
LHLDQPTTSRSIPADGYNANSAVGGLLAAVASLATHPRSAPPLPARAPPPVRISHNQQRPHDQVYHQSYPDSTTHGRAGGSGGYRDVTHHYDEDEEGEAVHGFQGEEVQGEGEGEGEDEEAHEHEHEYEHEHEQEDEDEEDYPGGEPVEYEEEERGYHAHHAHNYGSYEAGQTVEEDEEDEDEYDGGYGY